MTSKLTQILLAIIMAIPTALPARAGNGALDLDELSQMRLAYGWQRDDGAYVAAVVVDLAPGWKTYWRWAGGNGIPPDFNWSGSQNAKSVQYLWPTPQVFGAGDARTIGFENRLILPIIIQPERANQPVDLSLNMDFGICADICIPTDAVAQLNLAASEAERDMIELALLARPETGSDRGLVSASCALVPADGAFELQANLAFSEGLGQIEAAIAEAGSESLWISEPTIQGTDRDIGLSAQMMYFGEGPMTLDRSAMRFTLLTSSGGVEVIGCTAG